MPPFLSVKHELFTACFTFVFGNPTVAQSMGVKVPFISVFIRTVEYQLIHLIKRIQHKIGKTRFSEVFVMEWFNIVGYFGKCLNIPFQRMLTDECAQWTTGQ